MKFHLIFHLPNGEEWCPRGCCRDASWDSEFEFHQNLTSTEALEKAARYMAHPKYDCAEGEIHIIPETPSDEAFEASNSIGDQAKTLAKTFVKQREEAEVKAKADEKAKVEAAREAREKAELKRLSEKYQ